MKITLLGTGTSRGVPVIGCSCAVCKSDDPRDRRLRCSVLVEGQSRVVIDTSADFRQQMLAAGVAGLDGVVLTHHHADHILGLDDLFPLTARSGVPLPVYGFRETLAEVRITFRHLFEPGNGKGVARLDLREVDGPFEIGDLRFDPVTILHGRLPVLGLRIGGLAYLTDVNRIPDESFTKLSGLDHLVIDALRFRPHPTHFSIPEAIQAARRIGAGKTWFVHMSHEVSHAAVSETLPEGIDLACDGMVIEV